MFAVRNLLPCALVGLSVAGAPAKAQVQCLPIDRVQVQDAAHLSKADLQRLTAPFEGKCLGLSDFDAILEALTLAYVDRGYILARAYLPEQDLADGTLDIRVVEGQVSAVRINGEDHPRWARQVFPGVEGSIAEIRSVEQGLDQIEAMHRWRAQMEFTPGDAPGDSILDVSAATDKPIELRVTTHNRGIEPTGQWVTGVALDWTHMLGISDSWHISATKSLNPGPLSLGYDGDSSTSFGIGGEIPFGKWTFAYDHSRSHYGQTIPGAVAPIEIDGDSHSHVLSAHYLLHRDQTTKTTAEFSLSHASSQNYILGILIGNSSRSLTWARFGLAHERPLWQGQLSAEGHLEFGLPWFGAERSSEQPAGSPEAQYMLAGGSATWDRGFDTGLGSVRVTSTAKLQISSDRLYGGQQISIGGASTVRGTRIALVTGSSGVFWRNEAEWAPAPLSDTLLKGTRLYGALDWGRVFKQDDLDQRGGAALGGTIGVKYDRGPLALDVSYQKVLAASDWVQQPEAEVFVSAEMRF